MAEHVLYITIARVLWGFNIRKRLGAISDMDDKIGKL